MVGIRSAHADSETYGTAMAKMLMQCLVVAGCTLALAIGLAGCTLRDGGTAAKISPSEAVSIVKDGKAVVIDVRTPEEFAAGHVEGARNIDVEAATFRTEVGTLSRNDEYVLYCRSGRRSADAARIMVGMGFTNVKDAGGFSDLVSSGVPQANGPHVTNWVS